jgi:hypothetical protein
MCITLNTSTCFEQYYAHPQEVKIVFQQHLVSSLSVSGRAVLSPLSTGAEQSPWSRLLCKLVLIINLMHSSFIL